MAIGLCALLLLASTVRAQDSIELVQTGLAGGVPRQSLVHGKKSHTKKVSEKEVEFVPDHTNVVPESSGGKAKGTTGASAPLAEDAENNSETLVSSSKITVVSMCSGSAKEYCDTSTKNHQDYCNQHGYTYALETSTEVDKFAKFDLILSEFDKGAEFVMWIDADAVFTNKEKAISQLIAEEHFTNDILLARGPQYKNRAVSHGYAELMINNGVVIFRNTEFAKDFLRTIRSKGEIHPGNESIKIHSSNLVDQPRFVLELVERGDLDLGSSDLEFVTPHVTVVRPKKMNAFLRKLIHPTSKLDPYASQAEGDVDPWTPGDFIAHAAGLWGHGQRMEAFARVLNN